MNPEAIIRRFMVWSMVVFFSATLHPRLGETGEAVWSRQPLRTIKGETIRLGDWKGKVVLVNFWATWCPPCRDEIPDLVRLQKQYGDQGLVVIGVTYQDTAGPDRIRDFVEDFEISYPIVHDSQTTTQRLATGMGGVFGLPTSKLINRDGRLVAAPIGLLNWRHLVRLVAPLLKQKQDEDKVIGFLAGG